MADAAATGVDDAAAGGASGNGRQPAGGGGSRDAGRHGGAEEPLAQQTSPSRHRPGETCRCTPDGLTRAAAVVMGGSLGAPMMLVRRLTAMFRSLGQADFNRRISTTHSTPAERRHGGEIPRATRRHRPPRARIVLSGSPISLIHSALSGDRRSVESSPGRWPQLVLELSHARRTALRGGE